MTRISQLAPPFRPGLRRALVALALLLPATTVAQETHRTPSERAHIARHARQVRLDVLRHGVGLDARHAETIERIIARYTPERRRLFRQRAEARHELRSLLLADSNDNAAYARALSRLRQARDGLRSLNDREFEELRRHLSPKQQALYLRNVRETMHEGHPHSHLARRSLEAPVGRSTPQRRSRSAPPTRTGSTPTVGERRPEPKARTRARTAARPTPGAGSSSPQRKARPQSTAREPAGRDGQSTSRPTQRTPAAPTTR